MCLVCSKNVFSFLFIFFFSVRDNKNSIGNYMYLYVEETKQRVMCRSCVGMSLDAIKTSNNSNLNAF